MISFALSTLFLLIAMAVLTSLADSAARLRNAWIAIRRELSGMALVTPQPAVNIVSLRPAPAVPLPRSAIRPAPRLPRAVAA